MIVIPQNARWRQAPRGSRNAADLSFDRRSAAVIFGRSDGHATLVAIVDLLDNMVTHEFGHVLGFGTLWNASARGLVSGAGPSDPFFTGPSARAEFAGLFRSYAGNAVPVENVGDVGTRDTHWRRSVFNNELMQGFSQANMPMSRVTVGSLGDLGYTVDLSKADPFAFTFTGALRASAVRGAELVNDVVETEVWGVEKSGRRVLVRVARNPFKRN